LKTPPSIGLPQIFVPFVRVTQLSADNDADDEANINMAGKAALSNNFMWFPQFQCKNMHQSGLNQTNRWIATPWGTRASAISVKQLYPQL
jgi:hypothetical protein